MSGERFMGEPPPGLPVSISVSPPSHATSQPANFTLTLHPGRNYRLCLYGSLPASLLFLILWLIGPIDFVTRLGGVAFAGLVLVGSVAAVLYLRADRTLIVDSYGVRLLRSGKTLRSFPWEDVARVRYGITGYGSGASPTPVSLLWIHGRQGHRGLSIVESYWNVPPGSIWNASIFAAELAEARGVPVVRKDGLIRDFGP